MANRRRKGEENPSGARRMPAIANENAGPLQRPVAPWPSVDRFPVILGSNLTIAYLAAVYRLCQNGYRQQYVDALDDLLERDCHAQAVLGQRVLAVAGGRVEITPAAVADAKSPDVARAKEISADTQRRIDAIPSRTQALATLLFSALYYGDSADEILWSLRSDGWWVRGLGFIHSRRIAYPDQTDWEPHIWDQGAVAPGMPGFFPTEHFFGLRLCDFPGKFIHHAPSLRANYPTRDGIGRTIAWCMAIKLIAMRGAGTYVERFGKPWVLGFYTTDEQSVGKPRAATKEDIAAIDATLAAIGTGSLAAATLPDSVKVILDGPGVKGATGGINHEKLIDICDSQISKAVRGGTLTTDAGEKGARSLGEVHEEGDVRNARFDAQCLADTLKQDLVWWLVHLNFPGEEHLCPDVTIHVEKLSPELQLERALKLAAVGAPVDGRVLMEQMGVAPIDPEDADPIRLAPLKPTDLFALLPSITRALPDALGALAEIAGVTLPPAQKNALAEMDRATAARLIQEILGAAKAGEKATSAEGATEEEPAVETPALPKPPKKRTKPAAPNAQRAEEQHRSRP